MLSRYRNLALRPPAVEGRTGPATGPARARSGRGVVLVPIPQPAQRGSRRPRRRAPWAPQARDPSSGRRHDPTMMTAIMCDIDAMRTVPPQHLLMGTTGYRERLGNAGERIIAASDGHLDEDFFDALEAAGLTAASRRTNGEQRMVVYPQGMWMQSFRGVLNATAIDNRRHLELLLGLLLDYVDRVHRSTDYDIEIPSLTGVIIDKTHHRIDVVPTVMRARPHGDADRSIRGARPAAVIVRRALEGEKRAITTTTSYSRKIDALLRACDETAGTPRREGPP